MLLVFAVVGFALVFVIAAVTIGRESNRLAAQAPRPVFDLDEAVAWVADELAFEVSAVLSHDDVRRVLRWNLAHLQQLEAAEQPAATDPALPPSPFSVVGEEEAVERVLARAAAEGFDLDGTQVHAVLAAQLAYLDLIGAVGPAGSLDSAERDGTAALGRDTMSSPEKGGGPPEQTL